jgi:RNA polymerase sigma-70 factor (ECF subfamily)
MKMLTRMLAERTTLNNVETKDEDVERAFEERLRESAPLFRVAYGVLRQRQDAEDVAQSALVKAYARFGQLRDRDRFRAWLVRDVAHRDRSLAVGSPPRIA